MNFLVDLIYSIVRIGIIIMIFLFVLPILYNFWEVVLICLSAIIIGVVVIKITKTK